jgi:hypothetical protein
MTDNFMGNDAEITLEQALDNATAKIVQLTGMKLLGVVGALPDETGNFSVKVEIIERPGLPDTMDLVGLYEINLDRQGKMLNYSRIDMRKRGEVYKD